MSEQIRIRDNEATIKRLEYSDDTLNKLQKLISSPVAEEVKKLGIKKLTGVSPCCVCAGISTHEIIYNLEHATRIERYCEKCIKSVYAKEAIL